MTFALAAAAVAMLAHLFAAEWLGAAGPFVKAFPVAVLALVVLRSGSTRPRRFAAAGLAIASMADAIIQVSFLGGLVGFLVAHLFYVAAFLFIDSRPRWTRLAPIGAWAAVALPYLASRAGSMAIPVAIYGVVIFTMIWRAFAAVTSIGWNAGTMGLVGALCFGLSDTLLGYARFVAPLPVERFLIMGTYWTAQICIAASFALGPRDGQ